MGPELAGPHLSCTDYFCVSLTSYFNIILIFQALKMHAGQGLTRSLCLSPQCGHITSIFLPFIINLYLLIGLQVTESCLLGHRLGPQSLVTYQSSCLQLLSIRITDTILSCLVFVSSFDVAEMCINGHGCLVCGRSSLGHHMSLRYRGRSSLCHHMSRYLGTQGCCDFITTTGNLTNFQGLKPKPQLSPLGHLILFQSQISPDHGHCTQIQVTPNTNVLTGHNSRKLFLVELKKTMSQGALIYIGGNIRQMVTTGLGGALCERVRCCLVTFLAFASVES